MLAGLGFDPFFAAGICLLANTSPVAFGSIGIPVITLANVTGLPVLALSAMVGRLCAMMSVIIPGYLIVVMVGRKRAMEVLPAIVACGVSFAGAQLFVSNFIGPDLTDIISSLTCIIVMVGVLKFWRPKTIMRLDTDHEATLTLRARTAAGDDLHGVAALSAARHRGAGRRTPVDQERGIDRWTNGLIASLSIKSATVLNGLNVPGLHNAITRIPPVTAKPAPYAAVFTFNWLSASGTACFIAILAAALFLRVGPSRLAGMYVATFRQLSKAMVTIASMLASPTS